MVRFTPDNVSQTIAFVAVVFGTIAVVLTCVGIGTPSWQTTYAPLNGTTYFVAARTNFFYSCTYSSNGTLNNCTNRDNTLYGYPGYSSNHAWMSDYNARIQNAAALCIVGIVLLFFGTIATLIMALDYLPVWVNILPPALLFLACLFMLVGMAEGSRYLIYNDYSANLYQTGHLLTMLTLFLSAFAAGRINFSRWTRAGRSTEPK